MNAWIVAAIAVVGIADWVAVTIRNAPLGLEDENGFHLIGPDGGRTGFLNGVHVDRFYWSTTTVLLLPF